jgi:hypothetical protein
MRGLVSACVGLASVPGPCDTAVRQLLPGRWSASLAYLEVRIRAVSFSTWSRATAVASTATIHSPTASGCLMSPLLPCASVAAGGGPVSQLLRFALGLLCFGALADRCGDACAGLLASS